LVQKRRTAPTLVLASLLFVATTGGCSIAQDRTCFTKRAAVVLPDRTKVLANVTNGGSGRLVAEAILDGRIEAARDMLTRDPRLVSTVVTHDPRMDAAPAGQAGDLLTLAVSRCDMNAITMLLDAGMPIDGIKTGNALSLALLADAPDMAEMLLQKGASPDPQSKPGGEDPMATAISFSHPGAVMTLLRHGADPNWTDAMGIDRVRLAVDAEQIDIVELLIAKGGSVWAIAEDGSMAIHGLMGNALVFDNAAMNAARGRLMAQAQSSGLPWPPADRATVKQMVLSGKWPTASMIKGGMTISQQALARMRQSTP
jgi:hypothetical protein